MRRVDLRARADVHAARRLVEDDDGPRLRADTARAAASADCRPTAWPPAARASPRARRTRAPRRGRAAPLACERRAHPARANARQRRDRDVRARRHQRKQPATLAILGEVRDAAADRLGRRCAKRTARRRRGRRRSTASAPTIARPTDVRPAPTRPARPTISPARTVNETSRNAAAPTSAARPRARRRPARGRARELLGHVAPDHPADQLRRDRAPAAGAVRHAPAVAQHGHAIGEREDLVEAMRDVDDAEPARAQPAAARRAGDRPRGPTGWPSARPESAPARRRPSARAISTICCCATLSRATGASRVDVDAELVEHAAAPRASSRARAQPHGRRARGRERCCRRRSAPARA